MAKRKIPCLICGKRFFEITGSHLGTHGISKAEYKKRFGIKHTNTFNFEWLDRWCQPDVKPKFEGYAEFHASNKDEVIPRRKVNIDFYLDYITGTISWQGYIPLYEKFANVNDVCDKYEGRSYKIKFDDGTEKSVWISCGGMMLNGDAFLKFKTSEHLQYSTTR
jgi:hypothetical protein